MRTKIAVVENEPALCHALKLILNATNDFVCEQTFTSGEAAMRQLPDSQPNIVLMDIDLGEGLMTGIECITRLQPLCPKTLFMILTVYEDHQKVFDALSAGALGYVLKSANSDKIVEAIRDLKEGGSPMSPSIARKIALSFNQRTPSVISTSTAVVNYEILAEDIFHNWARISIDGNPAANRFLTNGTHTYSGLSPREYRIDYGDQGGTVRVTYVTIRATTGSGQGGNLCESTTWGNVALNATSQLQIQGNHTVTISNSTCVLGFLAIASNGTLCGTGIIDPQLGFGTTNNASGGWGADLLSLENGRCKRFVYVFKNSKRAF